MIFVNHIILLNFMFIQLINKSDIFDVKFSLSFQVPLIIFLISKDFIDFFVVNMDL
jgi:hypothetical protein